MRLFLLDVFLLFCNPFQGPTGPAGPPGQPGAPGSAVSKFSLPILLDYVIHSALIMSI